MSEKVTHWFPSKTKPVRFGIYERKLRTIGIRYAWWNGEWWGGFASDYQHAVNNQTFRSGHQDGAWRGLARKP